MPLTLSASGLPPLSTWTIACNVTGATFGAQASRAGGIIAAPIAAVPRPITFAAGTAPKYRLSKLRGSWPDRSHTLAARHPIGRRPEMDAACGRPRPRRVAVLFATGLAVHGDARPA